MKNVMFVFLFFTTLAFAFFPSNQKENNVIVFVIDSTSDLLKENKNLLSQFKNFSHGDAVCKLVGLNKIHSWYNVDDFRGKINNEKYLNSLYSVLEVARKTNKRVVVNISLGSFDSSLREKSLIKSLYEEGVIMIASAGNNGRNDCFYPAAYEEVIAVGATEGKFIASYSNNSKKIDILASGEYTETRTLTLVSERRTEKIIIKGTSFAAPRVTSLVIKMLETNPSLTKEEITDILQKTSKNVLHSRCSGGSIYRLRALAEISSSHKSLYIFLQFLLYALLSLSVVFLIPFVVFLILFVFSVILSPFLTYVFRLFMPNTWLKIKKGQLKKIRVKKEKKEKEIKFIIKCLIAQDFRLEEIARNDLLALCSQSQENYFKVRCMLSREFNRAKVDFFVNEKKPIDITLSSIDEIIVRK